MKKITEELHYKWESMSTNEKIKQIERYVDSDKLNETISSYFLNDYENLAYQVLANYVQEKYPELYRKSLMDWEIEGKKGWCGF